MSDSRIPTNLRMLLILEVVGLSETALTATEINREIGLPKQSIHRLIATLVAEGFLVQENGDSRYRPARRARAMGAGLLHASRMHIARHQILVDFSEEVKEAVNFVIPQDTGMHYLDRVETNWPFRIQLPRGSNVPFHCTASGKSFMASMDEKARIKFVESLTLRVHTENTLVTPDALLEELAQTEARGYALDNQEFMDQMIAIAMPIKDDDGRFVAALATHGPASRLTIEDAIAAEPILKRAVARLKETVI